MSHMMQMLKRIARDKGIVDGDIIVSTVVLAQEVTKDLELSNIDAPR